jgi:hypothetical protein
LREDFKEVDCLSGNFIKKVAYFPELCYGSFINAQEENSMGILGLIGLKTKGPYCFYTVGNETAVLIGIKAKKGTQVSVPENIGRYTVRGIDDVVCSGPMGDAMNALSEKDLLRLQKKLNKYHRTSRLRLDLLPKTVEYIGFSVVESNGSAYGSLHHDVLEIPAHIRYIRELRPSILFHKLVFPESLRYLGTVKSSASLYVAFSGPGSKEKPFHSLSDYLGKPMEEVPQLGPGTFGNCPKLHTLKLLDSIEKIGKNAMPSQLNLFNGYNTKASYELHLPKYLRQVDPEEFRSARIATLTYPDDLSQELRCQELSLGSIGQLIIHDMGQLEEYLHLVTQRQIPEHFPDKCLYHLIHSANRVVLPQAPKKIWDGMFAGCEELYQVTIGSMPETVNTALTISEGVEVIGNDAFAACHRLVAESFPSSLRHIGDRAFLGIKNSKLTLPEGLEYIGKQAFAKCDKLKEINIPTTLKELASDAFDGCGQLQLTPELLKGLEPFPETRNNLKLSQKTKVQSFAKKQEALPKKQSTERAKTEVKQPKPQIQPLQPASFYTPVIPAWTVPPVVPEPEPYISPYEQEEQERLNQLVSDYWAEQAAKQAAAEIESLWGELGDMGFWDDKSWQ